MVDIFFQEHVLLDSYEHFVLTERKPNEVFDAEWDIKRARDIRDEGFEFLYQHGPGAGLLMAGERWSGIYDQLHPDLRHNMKDELGDMLWFDFDIAAHHDFKPAEACARALSSHTGEPAELTTFHDLQQAIMAYAATEAGMNLATRPVEVLIQSQTRLTDVLELLGNEPAQILVPKTRRELMVALGDHINTLSYIGVCRLGAELTDVVLHNVYKLRHRKKFGKQAIHFFEQEL